MADKKSKHRTTYDLAEELGLMALSPSAYVQHALYCYRARKPLLVIGRPGCGKTEINGQISDSLSMMMITERLNGRDPTDFGLPYIYDDRVGYKRHGWSVPDWYFTNKDVIPEQYPGGVAYFYDELAQAYPAVQNRIGEILNERQLNRAPMHEKVWVMLASNFPQDKAATYPIPRHILNRCSVVVLAPDLEDFFRYCSTHDIHAIIPAFAKLFPDCLDSFDPDSMVNCTARSLASLSSLITQKPSMDAELALFASNIGKGWGSQFHGFTRVWRDLPKLDDIINNPDKTPIPDEDQTDVMCALAAFLGRAIDKMNAAPVVRFLVRLPSEFCVFAMRDAARREPKIKDTKAFRDWAIKHGDVLT